MIHWVPFAVDAASFVLNVVMFVPFGVVVPLQWPGADAYRRLASIAAAASFTIEACQFGLDVLLGYGRTVDVNDLVANVSGAVIGLAVLRCAVPSAVHRRFMGGASRTPPSR